MFTFLKRLFGKARQEITDPELIIEELWQTDFHKPPLTRFTDETGDSYQTKTGPKGLHLTLTKKNVYAWTVNPLYRYRDFVLESIVEFPKAPLAHTAASGANAQAGTMAAGFLFRYLNESTFYSVLVSDQGMVRMDAVVNGTPLPVLGWTETRAPEPETDGDDGENDAPYRKNPDIKSIRIISQATTFTIIVNDAWVAECTDDTIQAAGKIAFAGQNWAARDAVSAVLNAISLDSRPIEVETLYTRWNQYIRIAPEARINLARTWYAMGKYVPAIIELKRAWKNREPGTEELLLSGQIYLAQRLLPEAEEQVRKILAVNKTHEEAAAELAGILYLQNRFVDLDDLFATIERKVVNASPFLSNIEGHLYHWKGDREKAAAAYHRAATLAPDQGLFFFHEGNELKDTGHLDAAVAAWLEAARIFLSTENYDDLASLVPILEEHAADNPKVSAIAGKYWYAVNDPGKAFTALSKAVKKDSGDSAVWYLYGMMLSTRGRTADSIKALEKATALEPEYGPYWFRLAETRFFAGDECDEEMKKALETNEGNGWAHNLAALQALGMNDLAAAERHITEARRLLPDELPVLVNFAEIKRRMGKLDEALPLLDSGSPDGLRAGANLLVADGRHEEAEDWYIKALRSRPFDAELLTDRAANCLELDLLNEADDLLGRAIDIQPSARIYRLIAFLAGRKGEYARAEVALQSGIAAFPDDRDLLADLGEVYRVTNKIGKASEVLGRLHELGDIERAETLERDLEESSMNKLECALCGRSWLVPKDIPAQGSLHLTAQPPDDVPAGTCPDCLVHYCIGCAKESLGEDGRFRCKTCGKPLKLIDQNIIWLLNRWQSENREQEN
jgi:tetratricopeptide (TPR) repeat protein